MHFSNAATMTHCLISTATTRTGSSRACSGSENSFDLVLETALGQSKAVQESHAEPIKPLFHAVVT